MARVAAKKSGGHGPAAAQRGDDKKLSKEFPINSWIPVKISTDKAVWLRVVGYSDGRIQLRPNGTGVVQALPPDELKSKRISAFSMIVRDIKQRFVKKGR